MIRPTVDTLRRRPLRASMTWMRALPMNGYLRRTSITALTSLGFQARWRTRPGRVDFGARPPIQRAPADPELLQRAALVAARRPKPVVRLERPVRPAATAGTCSSTLKLRYDQIRMDSMFMGRVSFPVGSRSLEATRSGAGAAFASPGVAQIVSADSVPNVSELGQCRVPPSRLLEEWAELACLACRVLRVVSCVSCLACRVLHVVSCMSCLACRVLHVVSCMSCLACRVLHVVSCMSCLACIVHAFARLADRCISRWRTTPAAFPDINC